MGTKAYSARLTEELYYSCTCIKVKGGGVQLAEALTLANLNYEYQTLRQEAHTSPLLTTNQLHRCDAPLDFPTRRHTIALTLILASLRSIRFTCLIIKLSFPSSP